MNLDPVDWRLVRELYGWESSYPKGADRVSFAELGTKAGLHPKSVKQRVKKLRGAGVIDGPYFEPWPSALGLHASAYGFDSGTPRDAAALERGLASVPEVQLCVFSRSITYVIFWHDGKDAGPTLRRIEKSAGLAKPWKSFSTADFPSAPAVNRSPLDWRIALALRRTPARSLAAVARELGVTVRTVERRARQLIETRTGAMQIRFRPSKIEGSIYAAIVVRDGDDRAPGSLAAAFPDRVIGPFGGPVRPNVGVPVANLDEAERRASEAELLPGIKRVSMYLVRDWIYPVAFDEWLAERVANWTHGVHQP
ncbi:MAG: Lrp/AsnC family transcriptional regulator [bacterium]